MTKTATSRYDVAEHLRTPEDMAAYLEASIKEAVGDARNTLAQTRRGPKTGARASPRNERSILVASPYRRRLRNSSNVRCLPAASANCAVANEKLKSAACSVIARSACC